MPNGFVLINPESGLAETFDQPGAAQALQSGYKLPLNSPDGSPVAADFQEASSLLSNGHSQPSPEQLGQLVNYAKHSTLPEQVKAVGHGAAEALSGGLYGSLLSDESKKEALENQEANPGSHAIGEGLGTVAGMALLPEISAPGLIAKAGGFARAATAGKGLLGKAAGMATQGAVEGGLFGGTHALNERLMGDPNATAEHMLGTIGLSSALGGGLSLALAPVGRLAGKLLGDSEVLAPKTFEDVLHGEKEGVLEGLTKLKKNAPEIEQAGKEIGAPVTEGMISDSRPVQDIESRLSKSRTTPGIGVQQNHARAFEASGRAVDDALGTYSELSKAEVGNELKKGIIDKFKLEEEPIASLYDKVKNGASAEKDAGSGIEFKFGYQDIPVTKNEITSVIGRLKKLERADIPGETRNFISKLEEELPQLNNLQQLKAYRTELNDRLRGKPEFRYALGEAQKGLAELEENSIVRMAEKTAPPESPLHQEIKSLIDNRRNANKAYSALIEKMKDLGSVVGKKLRRGEGPGAFLEWLSDAPPEKIAEKIFTKENSEFLESFAKEFPQQAEVLKVYQKNAIRQKAFKDGKVSPANVLRAVDDLETEVQKFLFTESDLKKLKAASTIMEALPKDVNPSGTSQGIDLFEWLKHPLATVTAHAADYAQLQIIKNAVRRFGSPSEQQAANALIHVKATAIKTARAIDKHAGAIFGRAAESEQHNHPKKGEFQDIGIEAGPPKMNRLGTLVLNHANDPGYMLSHLEQGLSGISESAPDTSSAFAATISRAVGFLASKVPDTGRAAPLDPVRQPSIPELAKFNRYAQVVDNPVAVLEHIKFGTILPQDIETISTVYPALYGQMKTALVGKLTDALSKSKDVSSIPYEAKMGLSMFLGTSLDSTLSHQALQMNQGVFAPAGAPPPNRMANNTRPSKTGMGKINADADATPSQLAATRRANS